MYPNNSFLIILAMTFHCKLFQLLLRAERDILINDMIREKAKEEVKYCFNHFAEMSKCQQEHGIVSGLWKCTEENKVLILLLT